LVLVQVLEGDMCGETALTAVKNAISSHRCDVVKQLIELGCDVNMTDCDGWCVRHASLHTSGACLNPS